MARADAARSARRRAADVERATRWLREGRGADAEPLLRAVLAGDPDHFDALHLLGVIEGQQGRFAAAVPLLRRAASLRPDNPAVLNNLGNALAGSDHDVEAVATFDRALALQPAHPKALRNRGSALRRLGRLLEALDSLDRALALEPAFVDALVARAEVLETMHRRADAIVSLRAAIEAGGDAEALRYTLASLGAEPMPPTAPASYVRTLFDGYAGHFDKHLVDALNYRGPELVAGAIADATTRTGLDIVDLGCGTGLCGPLLRPRARRLVGVDLSAAMLAHAASRGVYDELVDTELVAWLASQRGAIDVAVAADVLIYVGALEAPFAAVSQALRPGGLFAFTVEAWPDDGFGLKPSRRYGHARSHVLAVAQANGLDLVSARPATLREESQLPIDGHVILLARPPVR